MAQAIKPDAASVEARAVAKTEKRSYFESLDLVRGLASLIVLVYHADFMFGLRHKLLPGGYLAVDLFFVLSGFVLSLNYGSKIAKGSIDLRSYAVARFARLYPLFALTTAVGLVVMTGRFRANFGYFDTAHLIEAAIQNLVMIPNFVRIYDMSTAFPFNPASWSIFFEVIASFLFFFCLGRLGRIGLILVALSACAVLTATIILFGTVDLGYARENILGGFPRVVFSFTIGMLIQRAFARKPWKCPAVIFYAAVALLFGLVQLRLLVSTAQIYDMVAVYLLLPALVAASAGVSLDGRPRAIALFLGKISYSVYLTQGTLIIVAAGLAQYLTGQKIYELGAWVGFVFVPCVMALSYLTCRLFELPARRLLRQLGDSNKFNSMVSVAPAHKADPVIPDAKGLDGATSRSGS